MTVFSRVEASDAPEAAMFNTSSAPRKLGLSALPVRVKRPLRAASGH